MKIRLLLMSVLISLGCYSQSSFIYSIAPNWNTSVSEEIKSKHYKSDFVYYYKKKHNNKDSMLIMTQFFDSSGYLGERDEYDFKGEVFRITNYTYTDSLLSMREVIAKEPFWVNGSNLSKKVTTYEYDSAGLMIAEKEQSFFGDSLKSSSVTVLNKEYDSKGYLAREFITMPNVPTYLYHTYLYVNGSLSEIKTYDFNQHWMYSYLYESNEEMNGKRVYRFNNERTVSHEYFYDGEKKLVKEKDYEQGRGLFNYIVQTYTYKPNGVLESQTLQDLKGNNYYYKHFYSQWTNDTRQ